MIEADLLLTNADFVTLGAPASAIAIIGERIVATEEVPAREVIDLEGAVVTPGFHDAHNHMAWFGLTLGEVDCRVDSLDALYAALAAAPVEGEWLIGSGYDQNKCGGHPHRDELDRIAQGRKVMVKHTSGHMCVVNTAVLAALGIDEQAREIDGGRVSVDPDGRPNGLLEERAQSLANELLLPYPVDVLADAIERAGRQYLSEGITSCVEAGIAGGWIGKSPVELEAYQRLREQGRLPVRVELMVASDVLHPVAELGLGLDLGLRTGFGDDWLRIGPMKIFSDGSLVGRTAAMTQRYSGAFCGEDNHGYLQADAGELTDLIVAAHVGGWRVATHAIGDAAIDLALDAYELAQKKRPRPDVRHRLEHFGVSRPDQVARAAMLGVVPVPQGRFISELGDGMRAALGEERVLWAYRQRSLIDAGIVVPGSSDRPVVQGAPLLGMHDLVNRTTASGEPFGPEETVTGLEALRSFTIGSAYASKQERDKGMLEIGKLADLVVLSGNPATVPPDTIKDIEVLRTMVGGQF